MVAGADRGDLLDGAETLLRDDKPVPGMPVFRNEPRLPTPMDAPRGPNVQLDPDPLRFHRMPGASFMDFRKRSATL